MKLFSYSPILATVAAAAFLTGCAGTASMGQDPGPDKMNMANANKVGCACCSMDKKAHYSPMKNQSMGMMQERMASGQGSMCTLAKDGMDKGGSSCCGMKMGKGDGCACCGMGDHEMSPEMHQHHMNSMGQQPGVAPQGPAK